ncbi:uncharacterized protein [Zea mays]|jgi:hypothetical protein|uniref:Uncharacterized protein n=1 Tax=Zea mays TaxID=4577 RepID=C0HIG0_MAIZE|nr:uncharacterized protein LOC118476031 [Zea mays]ACN26813.1 unknown [Zea mays]
MSSANDFKALTEALKSLQESVAANALTIAILTADDTSSPGIKIGSGEHHNDRKPRFQKLDFPRYDGRPIPSVSSSAANHTFISSTSWRRRSGWPPTTWRARRRCGISRSRRMRVLHRGAILRSCSTCATAPLSAPHPSLSWLIVVARDPSQTIRTASRRSSLVQDPSRRRNGSSSSGGSPSSAQPRRPSPQPAVPRGCHEPGAPAGAPGAVYTETSQGRIPWPTTSPGTASRPTCSAGRQGSRTRS